MDINKKEVEVKRKNIKSFVTHPKYGNEPLVTNYKLSQEEREYLNLYFEKDSYFPNTVIVADLNKQNCLYGLRLYVDVKVKCRDCHRSFIFFAQQQQYWFETLKFWIDSCCIRCYDCRQKRREIKEWQKLYNRLVLKENKSKDELKALKKVALELLQIGVIRAIKKINSIEEV